MNVIELLKKSKVGDLIYISQRINIKWNSMRFYNQHIEPVTYEVQFDTRKDVLFLDKFFCPEKVTGYPSRIHPEDNNVLSYKCFSTQEEAIIWKLLEWDDVDRKVTKHLDDIRKKATEKINKAKHKEKLKDYIERYPEFALKVL